MGRYQNNSTRTARRASPNPYYLGSNGLIFCCSMSEGGWGHDLITGTWGLASTNMVGAFTPRGDKALSFDGSTTFVDFAFNRLWLAANGFPPGYSNDVSISLWALFNSTSEMIGMEFGSDNNSSVIFGWGLNSSSKLSQMQANDFYGASSFTPSTGVWYHIVMVRNAAAQTVQYYINGVLNSTGTFTEGFASIQGNTLTLGTKGVTQANIGSTSGRGFYFNGLQSDIRIYPYQISPGMVWANYAAGQRERLRGKLRTPYGNVVPTDIPLNMRIAMSMP